MIQTISSVIILALIAYTQWIKIWWRVRRQRITNKPAAEEITKL